MGFLPLLIVVGGVVLAISGANTWLKARTDELERPGSKPPRRRPGATAVRLGLGAVVAGLVLMVVDVVLHTLLALAGIAAALVVVVAAVAVVSRLGGLRRHRG